MDSPTRKSSWRERLTYVSRKFGVGATTPASPSDKTGGIDVVKVREREGDAKREAGNEGEPELDFEDWCVLTVNGSNLSAVYRVVGDCAGEEVDGTVFTNRKESGMEREQTDGFFDRFRGSKKSDKGGLDSGKSGSNSNLSAGLGSRKSSFGSRLKPEGSKVTRPGSPQPLQRRSSGRGKPNDSYHANGQASPRSGSPNRSTGSSRRKASSSSNPPSRNESPNLAEPRRHELQTGLHVKQTHQNGRGGRGSPASNSASPAGGESAFSKVRDTLKISKAKKKLRKKKGTAYSVDPVEINFPANSKYHDPFEAQPNFTDSLDVSPKAQGHDFRPVSIPHNKPEYCDHCSETAWGIYRQVLKCSSKLCRCSFFHVLSPCYTFKNSSCVDTVIMCR